MGYRFDHRVLITSKYTCPKCGHNHIKITPLDVLISDFNDLHEEWVITPNCGAIVLKIDLETFETLSMIIPPSPTKYLGIRKDNPNDFGWADRKEWAV